MAPFSEVADELRTRYERAVRLDMDPQFNTVGDKDITRDVPVEDLVYLLDSPNYCKADVITGKLIQRQTLTVVCAFCVKIKQDCM